MIVSDRSRRGGNRNRRFEPRFSTASQNSFIEAIHNGLGTQKDSIFIHTCMIMVDFRLDPPSLIPICRLLATDPSITSRLPMIPPD